MASSRYAIPLGAILSLSSLPIHLFLPNIWSHNFAAILLGLISGIYIGSALNSASSKTLIIECGFALFCLSMALLGAVYWVYFIPLAYVFHGFWDYLHHHLLQDNGIPKWYINFCAIYDWIFAAGITLIWIFS